MSDYTVGIIGNQVKILDDPVTVSSYHICGYHCTKRQFCLVYEKVQIKG